MKRVFVTNIPVHAWVDGWVEVPEDTKPEALNDAIGAALQEGKYEFHRQDATEWREAGWMELNEASIESGWEFTTPLEET